MDRKIFRKVEAEVLDSRVVPASTYGLDTVALSNANNVDERGRTG